MAPKLEDGLPGIGDAIVMLSRPTLRPEDLVTEFGRRTPVARQGVATLLAALECSPQAQAALDDWMTLVNHACGRDVGHRSPALVRLAGEYDLPQDIGAAELLFAVQSYYTLLVRLHVRQLLPRVEDTQLLADDPLAWPLQTELPEIQELLVLLTEQMPPGSRTSDIGHHAPSRDWFKPLYQNLFPGDVRHALGEYYTPRWLAEHVLDAVEFTGTTAERLLDPSCGSGTFLLAAIDRLRQQCGDRHTLLDRIFAQVAGFDLNPVAVLSARANYLLAVADLFEDSCPPPLPVFLCDSILAPSIPADSPTPWDVVVGNPPWIAWDSLPSDYREVTKPLWQQYGLFSLSGTAARHGGGKKDLSMLMLYVAADRYLREGGRLGMVITQTVLQTKGAGDGFRRFQLGPEGAALQIRRVDDLSRFLPFADASNWTATLVLEKGRPTVYPVPYWKWSRNGETPEEDAPLAPGVFTQQACRATPIDAQRLSSPWLIVPADGDSALERLVGPADYQAHLGVNSGGANGVYWLELLASENDGIRVRNLVGRGKQEVPQMEAVIEPDLLYPLLRWGDIDRYVAQPRTYVLLAQDAETRRGIEPQQMAERWPRTLAYLEPFEGVLRNRSAYRRYQQEAAYWSMYNVGPYSLAPWKVVWRRMDRQIRAVAVGPQDDALLGPRVVLPQETCVLIAAEAAEEAHYLCGLLNSLVVDFLVHAHSVRGGKGFGTPSMLDYVPLRRFCTAEPAHREVATLAEEAQRLAQAGLAYTEVQAELDQRVGQLWGLSPQELRSLGELDR